MGNDGETDFPAGISVIRSRSRRHPPRRDRTARRKQPGDAHQDQEPFRAAAFHAGEINPALPDRRLLQQMYSAKDQYSRGKHDGTLKRPADDSSPRSTVSKRPPIPLEVISEIKRIGASEPGTANEHDATHVDVSRIIRPSHKVAPVELIDFSRRKA